MQWFFAKSARSSLVVLLAATFAAMPAFGAVPARERTAAAVMAVEHAWLAALQRRDVKVLAHILGREFVDSDFQGDAITRARYLAYFAHPLARPMPAVRQTFSDTMVRFVAGGTVAIATGVVVTRPAMTSTVATSAKQDGVRLSRFTDVFVWREARWQAVTGQETHFSPAAG